MFSRKEKTLLGWELKLSELKKGIYRRFDDEWIEVLGFKEENVLYKKLVKENEEIYSMNKSQLSLEIIFKEKRQLKYVFKSF